MAEDIPHKLRRYATDMACGYNLSAAQGPLLKQSADELERLTALLEDACKVFDHYDLPEHAFHYRRQLAGGRDG